MAKGSLKRTKSENDQFMKNATISTVIVFLIYFCYIFVLNYSNTSFWSWLLLSFYASVNFYILHSLFSMGKSIYEGNELVAVRVSLKSPGLVEYHWDVLYITWLVMLLSMFSSFALLLYSVIPGYAIYMFCNPCAKADEEVVEELTPEDLALQKKRARREERKRMKFVNVRR
eukprot:TRINITY_DN1719_c0_g1_i3.p1 TRINITY_DN1719_c0_g1~~TRINITY_DN1719_c0_g1_i3.p1  ORF type:complete len:172 (-),score=28.68 TRINITY_DN1719_c0_g1_i3:84-599(-)